MATFEQIQTEIQNMLDVPDDQLTDEQKTAMNNYLQELADQEADKVDAFAGFIREQTNRIEFYKEEAKRLSSKARTAENNIRFLRNSYLSSMQAHGIRKIRGNAYEIGVHKTTIVAVDEENIANLPERYIRRIPERLEANKLEIKAYLKAGGVLPGCRLVQSDSLQIR